MVTDQDDAPVVVAKAKAKRASRANPAVVVEPEVEVTASLDEVEAVVRIPHAVLTLSVSDRRDEIKIDTKVACPDCGKQMSAKTLKYSHGPNCLVKKQKQGDDEVAREQIDKSVFEEVIEHEVQKRLHNTRACRAVRRQEMVEKLMQNAF